MGQIAYSVRVEKRTEYKNVRFHCFLCDKCDKMTLNYYGRKFVASQIVRQK
jgi:hypothetical protein